MRTYEALSPEDRAFIARALLLRASGLRDMALKAQGEGERIRRLARLDEVEMERARP